MRWSTLERVQFEHDKRKLRSSGCISEGVEKRNILHHFRRGLQSVAEKHQLCLHLPFPAVNKTQNEFLHFRNSLTSASHANQIVHQFTEHFKDSDLQDQGPWSWHGITDQCKQTQYLCRCVCLINGLSIKAEANLPHSQPLKWQSFSTFTLNPYFSSFKEL